MTEPASQSHNRNVKLLMDSGGAGKVGAWQNETSIWTTSADYEATTAAIAEALNDRYSLRQDGVFVPDWPYLSGLSNPTEIIE